MQTFSNKILARIYSRGRVEFFLILILYPQSLMQRFVKLSLICQRWELFAEYLKSITIHVTASDSCYHNPHPKTKTASLMYKLQHFQPLLCILGFKFLELGFSRSLQEYAFFEKIDNQMKIV
jgi:hypothetical protein